MTFQNESDGNLMWRLENIVHVVCLAVNSSKKDRAVESLSNHHFSEWRNFLLVCEPSYVYFIKGCLIQRTHRIAKVEV